MNDRNVRLNLLRNSILLSILLMVTFLSTVWLSSSIGNAASSHSNEILVRVNVAPGTVHEGYVPVQSSGSNAFQSLLDFLKSRNIPVETKDTSFGPYIVSIAGVAEKTVTAAGGWGFWVNGNTPEAGADQTILKSGDELVWSYYDYASTLYPIIEVQPVQSIKVGEIVTVRVQANKTTYDADWNATTTRIPVVGAVVEFFQDSQSAQVVTDTNGNATYTVTSEFPIRIVASQYDRSNGMPLLVKSRAQWLSVSHQGSFTDVTDRYWAAPCIERAATNGWMTATSSNVFSPKLPVSRADALQALGMMMQIKPLSNWTESALHQGWIINGEASIQNKPLTRQHFAIILQRILTKDAAIAAQFPMIQTNIPAAKDQQSIKAYASNSIQEVRARGLMNVYANGTFRAEQQVTRAELVHVVRILDDARNRSTIIDLK